MIPELFNFMYRIDFVDLQIHIKCHRELNTEEKLQIGPRTLRVIYI